MTETKVSGFHWDADSSLWNVKIERKSGNEIMEETILAKAVVNCAGNYSDDVNKMNDETEDFWYFFSLLIRVYFSLWRTAKDITIIY